MVLQAKYRPMWQTFLVSSGAVLLTTLFHWIAGRKKTSAAVDNINATTALTSVKTLQEVISIWRDLVVKLTKQVEELTREVLELREEKRLLRIEITKLEAQIVKLETMVKNKI